MVSDFDLAQIQGNVVRGYRKQMVRHVILEVSEAGGARRWLRAAAGGDGASEVAVVTPGRWAERPDTCFNIGVTHPGLRALGVSDRQLDALPEAFRQGMAARAHKLGDVGPSDPSRWAEALRDRDRVHLIATFHADSASLLDDAQGAALGASRAFNVRGTFDGGNFDGDEVHFGYRDNISQPRFQGVHDETQTADGQPLSPLGVVLLGHPTAFEGVLFDVPEPKQFGGNGAYNAFRILEQHVQLFEDYLDDAAAQLEAHPLVDEVLPPGDEAGFGEGVSRHAALREVVAAKLCGRWRTGVPLSLSPSSPRPNEAVSLTDFDYADDDDGLRCPFGSHTRRCNPREATIVQRVSNHTRRLVRRGMPYGPRFDPSHPVDAERGLLGNFLCADLAAQFEAVHYDWLNLGLQDPRLLGSNDPLLGANEPDWSVFTLPVPSGAIELRGFPSFVTTRGGAYTFIPSISGLSYLGSLDG